MKNLRFWIPTIVGGLIIAPACLYLIVASGGSGESGHAGAGMGAILLFYPLPAALMMLAGGAAPDNAFFSLLLSRLAYSAMVVQFPLYGFTISYANLKRNLWLRVCAALVWLHLIVIVAGLAIYFLQVVTLRI